MDLSDFLTDAAAAQVGVTDFVSAFIYCLRFGWEYQWQSKMDNGREEAVKESSGRSNVTLKDLQKKMAEFALERDWDQFHSPRNLLLALVGEVGELSEIFQWKGEVPKGLPDWDAADKEHLGEELSDVLLYLVRLADICGVDFGDAVLRKLEKNGLKYPVQQSTNYAHSFFDDDSNENNEA